MLSFIPLGFLIVLPGRPPVRLIPATLLAAAVAVLLGAGKFLFHARHTSVVNIVMQVAGGLLGALLASRLAHAKHSTAWPRAAGYSTRPGTYRRKALQRLKGQGLPFTAVRVQG
jgi:hypothetical protein